VKCCIVRTVQSSHKGGRHCNKYVSQISVSASVIVCMCSLCYLLNLAVIERNMVSNMSIHIWKGIWALRLSNSINQIKNEITLSLISLFWKNECRLMRSPCCLFCVCGSPLINFWMSEPVFIKHSMYIMAPDPLSTAYFINPSHHSVCLYVYPSYLCKQRLAKV
jgi:hypothetical protein